MKWGQRKTKSSKNSNVKSMKTKSGENISIHKKKNGWFVIKNSQNKKVGDFFLDEGLGDSAEHVKIPGKVLNINYLTVKNKYRGKGYATAAVKYINETAKKQKYNSIVSEAINPKMARILEREGHKTIKDISNKDNFDFYKIMEKRLK